MPENKDVSKVQQNIINTSEIKLQLKDGYIVFKHTGNGKFDSNIFREMIEDKTVQKYFAELTKADLDSTDKLIQHLSTVIKLARRGYSDAYLSKIVYALNFENDLSSQLIKEMYNINSTAEEIIAYASKLSYEGKEKYVARLSKDISRVRYAELFLQVFQKELDGAINRMNNDIRASRITDKSKIQISKYFNPDTIINKLNMASTYKLNQLLALAETSSPLEELSLAYATKVGGPDGLNEKANVTDLAILPKENVGIISAYDTPENNNTSRVNRLALGARINNFAGQLEAFNQDMLHSVFSILSPIEAMIPFIEHNDGNRVLLASNQLRSVVPTKMHQPPIIQTGIEGMIPELASSIFSIQAEDDGKVLEKTDSYILVQYKNGTKKFIDIGYKPLRTGKGYYMINMYATVNKGDTFRKNDFLATTEYTQRGKLQLGNNVLIAFMHYKGLTFEDGIVVSETYAKKLGVTKRAEVVTIPIFKGEKIDYLNLNHEIFMQQKPIIRITLNEAEDEDKITEVNDKDAISIEYAGTKKVYKANKGGKILDIQIYPNIKDLKNIVTGPNANEILQQLEKYYNNFKDRYNDYLKSFYLSEAETEPKYLIAIHGQKFQYENKTPDLIIRIVFEKYSEAQLGDKLCNRHGNKGVIATIVPDDLMPRTEYGEKINIILDPLGVINRMNLGQVFEANFAYISKHVYKNKVKDLDSFIKIFRDFYITLYEDTPYLQNINQFLRNLSETQYRSIYREAQFIEAIPIVILPFFSPLKYNEKLIAKLEKKYDIKTNQKLYLPEFKVTTPYKVQIGYMYMFRLEHVTEEVLHARFTGARDVLTKQAKKGRKRQGGFAFGEFDSWQFLAYDAPNVIAELAFVNAESEKFSDVLKDIMSTGKAHLPDSVEKLPSQETLDIILEAFYLKR